jgi:hypothetical protein
MKRSHLALIAAALLLAGCGGADDRDGPAPAPSPAPTATPRPSPLSPKGPTPGTGPTVTIQGVVRDGVEAGCLILEEVGGGSWLLLGARGLRVGDSVAVTGYDPGPVATTCQQGRPLRVVSTRPNAITS